MLESAHLSPIYKDVSQVVTQRTMLNTQQAIEEEKEKSRLSRTHPLATFNIETSAGNIAAILGVLVGLILQLKEHHNLMQRLKHVMKVHPLEKTSPPFIQYAYEDYKAYTSLQGKMVFAFKLISSGIVPGISIGLLVNGVMRMWQEYQSLKSEKNTEQVRK
jgi:hypothetical protein